MTDASAPKREPVDVQRLRELCEKAEPGPWTVVTHDGRKNIGIDSAEVSAMDHGGVVANLHITAWKQDKRDARPSAAFIAAARTAIPACLDEIEDLRVLLKAAPLHHARWCDGDDACECSSRAWIDKRNAALRGEPKEGM
jgi:hypothetical protein